MSCRRNRYSRTKAWIRLYMDIDGSEFRGGTMAARENFEIALENGKWKCFETDLAKTAKGELILGLREGTTLEILYERIGEGVLIEEEIRTIEDLATYMERRLAE